jgi:2-oxoacid:acceptor oxidoreductase gamma subunit (pyruvate/2-ketoisovalerate family)
MIEVRFHGRGGQGAKLASRIFGTSGFLAGLFAQDFALFGAERRGAPVVSCTRLSAEPIERRGYLDEPDFIVVLEDTLLTEARAQVLRGVHPGTPVFIDSAVLAETVRSEITPAANLICLDLSGLSRRLIGHGLISAAAAGVADYVIVMTNSFASIGKAEVKRLRGDGKKVGLARLRMIRPFPHQEIQRVLRGRKGAAVVEQNISVGKGGILFSEIASALYGLPDRPPVLISFIGGLGGRRSQDGCRR